MSSGDDWGPHETRLYTGAAVIVALILLGAALILLYLFWKLMVVPNIPVIATLVKYAVIIVLSVYLTGYLVTDLPDDVREWMSND